MHHDRLSFSPPLIITEAELGKALDTLYTIIAGVK
jgi:4-aminobutyrate aminotransferase-like enzyme